MPSVVTTTPRGFFHAEIPFEVAVCTMGLMGPLLPKSFFLVLTYDVAGRLPAQLLSSRMPSACNVLLGYAHIGEELTSMSTIRQWLRDHVGPCIVEADGMPPVNWDHRKSSGIKRVKQQGVGLGAMVYHLVQ